MAFAGDTGEGDGVIRLYFNGHQINTGSTKEFVDVTIRPQSLIIDDKANQWDVAVESFSLPNIGYTGETGEGGHTLLLSAMDVATSTPKLYTSEYDGNLSTTLTDTLYPGGVPVVSTACTTDGAVFVLESGVSGLFYVSPGTFPVKTPVWSSFDSGYTAAGMYVDFVNNIAFILALRISDGSGKIYIISSLDGTAAGATFSIPSTAYPRAIVGETFTTSKPTEGHFAIRYTNTSLNSWENRVLGWFSYNVSSNLVTLFQQKIMRQTGIEAIGTPLPNRLLRGIAFDPVSKLYFLQIQTGATSGSCQFKRVVWNGTDAGASIFVHQGFSTFSTGEMVIMPASAGSLMFAYQASSGNEENCLKAYKISADGSSMSQYQEQLFSPAQTTILGALSILQPVSTITKQIHRIVVTSDTLAVEGVWENDVNKQIVADFYPDIDGISVSNVTRIVYNPFVRRYTSIRQVGGIKDVNVAFWYDIGDGILRRYPLLNGQAAFFKLCFRKRLANNPF